MKLFVYGTLRRGESAARLMRGAAFLTEAAIRAKKIEREGFPGLVAGDDTVPGELYEVPEPRFRQLDHYEGPGYERRQSEVASATGPVTAWVYWLR